MKIVANQTTATALLVTLPARIVPMYSEVIVLLAMEIILHLIQQEASPLALPRLLLLTSVVEAATEEATEDISAAIMAEDTLETDVNVSTQVN